MTAELPKWPKSLPPPVELIEGPTRIFLSPQDLSGPTALADLVHGLYWFPDSEYFLYFKHGAGLAQELKVQLEGQGVELRKTELYFYEHPHAAYPNDLIRILPASDVSDWQMLATQGQMFGRVSLTLESAARKRMDLAETVRATSTAVADSEPVIEVKPNFYGLGINLNSLWKRIKNRLRRERSF